MPGDELPPPPPARRRGGCLKKLALSALSLAVACVVAEFVARRSLEWTVAHHEPPAPQLTEKVDYANLGYVLVPGKRYVALYPKTPRSPSKIVEYLVNADGFRDPKLYARPKPTGTYRIAIVGDSFTFGIGVAEQDAYPKVIERKLVELVPEFPVEVMNCGVYGYNTRQEIALLQKQVLAYEPDLVFLCFYMNDVMPVDLKKLGRPWEAELSTFLGLTFGEPREDMDVSDVEKAQWWLRQQSVLLDHLAAALELKLRVRAYNRTLRDNWGVKDSPGWSELRTYVSAAPNLCREHGSELRLMLFPDLTLLGDDYPWREQHAAVKKLCRDFAVPFYDLLPIVEHEAPANVQVHEVDHHPNERCHLLVGEKLAEGLAPTIRKLVADRAKAK